MPRHRRKQLRYGISSGILSFAAGWAAIALTTPKTAFGSVPRWKSTLWVYLGLHDVTLSNAHTGGFGFGSVDPVAIAGTPSEFGLLPVVAVGLAAAYTCYELQTSRLKYNVANASAAATGYFLAGLVAVFASDIRPTVSSIILIAVLAGGGIWIGTTVIGSLSNGLPFLGIASLGTLTSIGVLVILGGVAILSAIQGLIIAAYGGAILVGVIFGASRHLERKGTRYDRTQSYPRTHALKGIIEDYWLQIVLVAGILIALYYGLSGNVIQP